MKTQILITIMTLSLLIVSCNKSSPAPIPAPVNSVTSVTTVTLNIQETKLIGDWSHDKTELYLSGSLVTTPGGTVYFNDSLVYHILFNAVAEVSPLDPSAPTGTYKECYEGTSMGDMQSYWRITPTNKLQLGSATYSVYTLTSTNLVYYTGSLVTGSAIMYYLHKMP